MERQYDVVVIGGGPGGCGAAVAAAKAGARTLLVERYGFLGGMATAGMVNPFMPYRIEDKILTTSVFNEMIDRMAGLGALDESKRIFDDEMLKHVLDEMMAEHGVDVLLHSKFAGVQMKGTAIDKAEFEGKCERYAVKARMFIDSTGDGDLAAESGAEIEIGRKEDGLCQPMTLCFRVGGVEYGEGERSKIKPELNEIFQEAKQAGVVSNPRHNILFFRTLNPNVFHMNTVWVIKNTGLNTRDATNAEIQGRRLVKELFQLFRAKSRYLKNAYLAKMACQIGIRETRRAMGPYVITEEDMVQCRKYEDGIARNNFPIDVHCPTGTTSGRFDHLPKGEYYEIPYRCIVPNGVDNLLIGSRCVSSTHEAHASLRIMPTVCGMGEAAGMAAAKCAKEGCKPAEVDGREMKEMVLGEKEVATA